MTDVVIIEPSEDEACCCCGAERVRLHKWVHELIGTGTSAEHQHCDLCYSTLVGNTCVYPRGYDVQTSFIVQRINGAANIILAEIRKLCAAPTSGESK